MENQEQPKAESQGDALLQNMRIMNAIVAEMRQDPPPPSERPNESHALEKVEFPPMGGILTYMDGYSQPYKGFPYFEFVDKIDGIKKTLRHILSATYHSINSRPWWQKAFLATVPWIGADIAQAMLYTFWRAVDRFKIKTNLHCTAIRELYRAFSVEFHGETSEQRLVRTRVRDVVCMILEFDNAYRYRFQDIVVELSVENARKDLGRELIRLFDIMQSREVTQEIKDTWTLVKFFLPLYLKLNKNLRMTILGILTELDKEKLKLSVEDEFFCKTRKDYQFRFMDYVSH